MPDFTPNDLLLYVLNEVNADTRIAIEKAMQTNCGIKIEVSRLKQTIDEIDQFEMQPDAKILDFVMEDLHRESKTTLV